MSRIAARRSVTRIRVGESTRRKNDYLAVEEPLEIRVAGQSLAVTMRTPGHDFELAAGFMVSEGLIRQASDFSTARYCAGAEYPGAAEAGNTYNVLDVTLGPGAAPPDPKLARNFTTTSACGLCGKASIDQVRLQSAFPIADDPVVVGAQWLASLPVQLRAGQEVFERTGGLHAAGLFDAETGELLVLREDVGRHNAVDKVIGWALIEDRLPARSSVLMVSGRASFELMQKAILAGIPMLAAVSAPSSLAAELAEDAGATLVGFLRDETMVVYSRPDRITNQSASPSAGDQPVAPTAKSHGSVRSALT